MLELLRRDAGATLQKLQKAGKANILAVADEGVGIVLRGGGKVQRLRITVLWNEAVGVGDIGLQRCGLDDGDVGLVGFVDNALDEAFADGFTIIVHKEYLLALRIREFEGEEELALGRIVAEDCQAGALRDAVHTADAFVVVDHGRGRC